MKLEEINKLWIKDSIIDKTNLETESLNIPYLHGKYLNIMSQERIILKKLMEHKKVLSRNLEDYYTGKIDGKDIGRPPWQLSETKGSVEKRIDTDKEVITLNLKMAEQEEKVLALKEIINSINQRTWHIRNAIEFMKWSQGGGV